MEKKQNISPNNFSGKLLIASLFILSGILLFVRNMGWITPNLFSILVSWYSLLIILGIYAIIRHYYIRGFILLLIGAYFLLGGLSCLPPNTQAIIWPLALVLAGILFFIKGRRKKTCRLGHRPPFRPLYKPENTDLDTSTEQQCESVDGYLHSNNTFGAMRHVILDDLFKGATISTFFGGTTIDLRHTHLAVGETYIDLECICGGIELFIPSDWKIVIQCNAFFGGCEDKRWQTRALEEEKILVIRGKISFGGLEIKD